MRIWPFNRESAEEKRQKEILNQLRNIMSAIKDYADRVNAKFDDIEAATTALGNAIGGIADDVAFLKETIEKLQNSPGTITPEDQALLDAAEARAGTAATNLGALKTVADQLNAATERPATP